jgi:hypothetical protein
MYAQQGPHEVASHQNTSNSSVHAIWPDMSCITTNARTDSRQNFDKTKTLFFSSHKPTQHMFLAKQSKQNTCHQQNNPSILTKNTSETEQTKAKVVMKC